MCCVLAAKKTRKGVTRQQTALQRTHTAGSLADTLPRAGCPRRWQGGGCCSLSLPLLPVPWPYQPHSTGCIAVANLTRGAGWPGNNQAPLLEHPQQTTPAVRHSVILLQGCIQRSKFWGLRVFTYICSCLATFAALVQSQRAAAGAVAARDAPDEHPAPRPLHGRPRYRPGWGQGFINTLPTRARNA